jgi:RNA polymerase sigma factor (sigma-70 family)
MVEMHEKSDVQLLRDYAEDGHEAAFRELVTRHADFVFSAALRQVNSPDLAGDIAQGVFTDLAHKARLLAEQMPGSLAGWLHRGTRYAALNHLRDTRRRLANERQAMEQLLINSESAPDWERIRPVLDEALDSLGDEDREALLLRYFKNQDFRAVGLALGVSDDTAQKRVSRAVERLREFFSKRNVTIGASGLVVLISANAIQAAPVGLAATISAAAILAGTAVHTSTIIAATKTIAMTTLQKTFIAATLTAAIGTGIFEAHQASQLREQNQTLQQQQAPLAEQVQQLQRERDDATNRLAGVADEIARIQNGNTELLKLRGEIGRLRGNAALADDPFIQKALVWKAKLEKIKSLFDERPDQRIPELQFVTDQEWLDIAIEADLDSSDGVRNALGRVRYEGKNHFASMIQKALNKFTDANNGNRPNDVSQLKPFFDPPTEDSLLQRYRVLTQEEQQTSWLEGGVFVEKSVLDKWHDNLFVIGPHKIGIGPGPQPLRLSFPHELMPVMQAYQNANNRQTPDDFSKLNPYVTTPEQKAALENLIKTLKDGQAP